MPELQAFEDPENPGNSSKLHTGKLCVEGCGRPAGTAWSPHWCFECNVARIRKIDARMKDIRDRFKERESAEKGK
jgi:hypothetical protein